MILKLKNPTAHKTNMFNPVVMDGICCGDKTKTIVCKYSATIDVSNPVMGVVINETQYPFLAPVYASTEKGAKALVAKILAVVCELGYTDDGISYKLEGSQLTLDVYFSQLVFTAIAGVDFKKVECMVVGEGDCCDVEVVTEVVQPKDRSLTLEFNGGEDYEIRDENGVMRASWTDDGTAASQVQTGGNIANALDAANLSWSFDGVDKLTIFEPIFEPVLYNVTQDAQVSQGQPEGDVYFCIVPVSCSPVKSVVVNDGDNDIYNGPFYSDDNCETQGNVKVMQGKITINATAQGYTSPHDFGLTMTTTQSCGVVSQNVTVD